MKIQLTVEKFEEILNKGYSLDQIYILRIVDTGFDVMTKKDVPKWNVLLQSLIRKGLLFETENKLTTIGKELLIFIDSKESKRIVKPKVTSTDFDSWWSEFPGTDSFTYKGKTFTGSRSLRCAKDDCRVIFNKILIEGDYNISQLIEALKLDIFQKKEKSYQTGTNKLSYMQNSATYLRQRSFEPFIELLNSGIKPEETSKPTNGIDI